MSAQAAASTIQLELVREYPASPARVWQAWTTPEALSRWFAPTEDSAVLLAELDPRVGGRYRIRMRSGNGDEHEVQGEYLTVEPERRLVMTWEWTDQLIGTGTMLVTVTLKATPAGTQLRLVHSRFTDMEARGRHEWGWTGSLGRLPIALA
jgi:uncharacterized protein YndB with AHSA1/START domain